jgi:hypothetical protein
MPYDKQLFVQVDMDYKAGQNRVGLEAKAGNKHMESATVWVNLREKSEGFYHPLEPTSSEQLRAGLQGLTNESRLYILGHGDWKSQRVGELSGRTMARLLFDHGLRNARVISVVACEAGRDKGANDHRLAETADSFASHFHLALCTEFDLYIDVVARTREVTALPAGYGENVGRKVTMGDDGVARHKTTNSKVRFRWQNGQVRDIVQYQDTSLYPTDEPAENLMW